MTTIEITAMINSSMMNAPVRFIHVPKVTILFPVTLTGGLVDELSARRETPAIIPRLENPKDFRPSESVLI